MCSRDTPRTDERFSVGRLPCGTTLAQWFSANELDLQRDPNQRERTAIVAAALLPLFEAEPACWKATDLLEFDMSHGSFAEFLADWHQRVPERLRPFVRRIAQEFGLEVGEWKSR